jgi:DNA-binding MarR family transcriptional regulator
METKRPTVPRSIGRQLNFAAGAASAVATRLLEPHGLSLAQWAVLTLIWRNGDLSVTELARLTGNAAPATSRIVDRMVSGGLLQRETDPRDRRAVIVSLSARAEALRHLQDIYQQVNAVALAGFSDAEAATLFALLDRVETSGRDWLAGQDKL